MTDFGSSLHLKKIVLRVVVVDQGMRSQRQVIWLSIWLSGVMTKRGDIIRLLKHVRISVRTLSKATRLAVRYG